MIFGAFSGLWMPLAWPQASLASQVAIAFVITLAAILGGVFALRHYAREDEVTIDAGNIEIHKYNWIGSRRSKRLWSEVDHIEQSKAGDYQVLELVFNKTDKQRIAVFISKNLNQAMRTKERLEGFRNKV